MLYASVKAVWYKHKVNMYLSQPQDRFGVHDDQSVCDRHLLNIIYRKRVVCMS